MQPQETSETSRVDCIWPASTDDGDVVMFAEKSHLIPIQDESTLHNVERIQCHHDAHLFICIHIAT